MLIGFSGFYFLWRGIPSAPRPPRAMGAASGKSLEKFPDNLCAVDVMVLRPQRDVDGARKARIGEAAGHAVAAVIDAVEHDIASGRTAGFDPRYGGPVILIAVGE